MQSINEEFAGRKIYVGGEVNVPGILRPAGRITALQAIFEAGGFKDTAQLGHVVVLRNQGTPEPLFLTVDLRQSITGGDETNDLVLKPYAIVFVPKTRIARMNQFVDQYVRELLDSAPYFVGRNRNPGLEAALCRLDREQGLDVVHLEFGYLAPLVNGLGPGAVRILACC